MNESTNTFVTELKMCYEIIVPVLRALIRTEAVIEIEPRFSRHE